MSKAKIDKEVGPMANQLIREGIKLAIRVVANKIPLDD